MGRGLYIDDDRIVSSPYFKSLFYISLLFPNGPKVRARADAQLAMLHIRAASGLSSFKRIQGCTSIIAASRSGPRHVLLACAVSPLFAPRLLRVPAWLVLAPSRLRLPFIILPVRFIRCRVVFLIAVINSRFRPFPWSSKASRCQVGGIRPF